MGDYRMATKEIWGVCHLCREEAWLQNSHVWPSFIYKEFVSELSKGGQFADLVEQKLSGEQFMEHWFCKTCEGRFGENATARLCRKFKNQPNDIQDYGEEFFRFVVSISYRVLKFLNNDLPMARLEAKWPAARQWRRYLLGKEVGVKHYTNHVYLISNDLYGFKRQLGGRMIEKPGFVFSQAGPLLIVGQLGPDRLNADDHLIWEKSKVSRLGGKLKPLREWRTGRGYLDTHNITFSFAQILGVHQHQVLESIASFKFKK
jgi:hypothetical protein